MLEQLTPEQFGEWMSYYEVEPWGLEPEDYRAAMSNMVIASAAGAKDFDPFKLTVRGALDIRKDVIEDPESLMAHVDALLGIAGEEERAAAAIIEARGG